MKIDYVRPDGSQETIETSLWEGALQPSDFRQFGLVDDMNDWLSRAKAQGCCFESIANWAAHLEFLARYRLESLN